jgi:phosphatidylglycerophosphate synthase
LACLYAGIFLAAGGGCIGALVAVGPALLWTAPAAAVLAYVLIRLRHLLPLNTRLHAPGLHPRLGAANWITLVRAGMIAGLAGLAGQPAWVITVLSAKLEWAPGALYLTVVALDFADGLVARATKSESPLGERLDAFCDGLGLLVASALAVGLARAPAVYLAAGAGAYILQAAVWVRRKSGRPTAPVEPRPGARLVAGVEMVFAGLILLPLFDHQVTGSTAWVMTAALALSLGKDWLVVCGCAAPDGSPAVEWLRTIRRLTAPALPLALRAGIAAAALSQTGGFFPDAAGILIRVSAALCAMGVAARASAVLLSLSAAWPENAIDPGASVALSACGLALIMTGAGSIRLWQPEDRFFLSKLGAGVPGSGGESATHPRPG